MEPCVARFLTAFHQADTCLGLEAVYRSQQDRLPHLRTLYRWQQRLAGHVSYFPAFTLEQLGLVHLHLFITRPDPAWARFPYAVEGLWVTQNLVDPVLYLHCLIPLAHRNAIQQLLNELPLPHAGLGLVWSTNSWQRLHLEGFAHLSQTFPSAGWPTMNSPAIPRALLFAVPVIGEAWNQRLSLNAAWQRIRDRLRSRIYAYLPHQRIYTVNGKTHIKDAYRSLLREGAFRQYLIRYQDECSLLVIASRYQRAMPPEVSTSTRAAELFPTDDGGSVWRLQGSYELLRSRAALAGHTVYLVENTPAPTVRFCYEWLVDPKRARWRLLPRRIARHMETPP